MIPVTLIARSAPSRWLTATAAPHRPMFFLGAVQLVLVMTFWLAELAGRAGVGLAAPPALTLPATWAHVALMLYALFIFFIYGFLFTVFPRWLGGGEIPRRRYLTVAAAGAAAAALVYGGLWTHRAVVALGAGVQLFAWLLAAATLLGIYRASAKRGPHELVLLGALGLGALGLAALLYAILGDSPPAYVVARELGVWGFLAPVLLAVCHRMIPFFTQSALPLFRAPRPAWSLAVFVGGAVLHGAFELLGWTALRLAVDAALAAAALQHTVLWGLTRSFANRLLAMLHVAFLWFGLAMLLYAVQGAMQIAGTDTLGRAPLHALGIGFVTGTLVAMATRVTLGHSGRALAVKAPTWYLFLGINLVAILRVAAELAPAAAYQTLNLLSAAGWLACLLPWALRYAPMYLRPRADRRPG